jgi:uncharacterized repeat protein (TIGR01451 family)
MKQLFIILAFFCWQNLALGQGWQRILSESLDVHSVCNDYDGGFMIVGTSQKIGNRPVYDILKIDSKGGLKWRKTLSKMSSAFYSSPDRLPIRIVQTNDDAFLFYGQIDSVYENGFALRKIDRQGNELWTKVFPIDYPVLKMNDSEIFLTGKSRTFSTEVLLRLNSKGDTISQKIIEARPADFEIQKDGLFCINTFDNNTLKLNFEGKVVWKKKHVPITNSASVGSSSVMQLRDSTIYVSHDVRYLSKNKKNGDSLWVKDIFTQYPDRGINPYFVEFILAEDGVIGMPREPRNNFMTPFKIDKNGALVWVHRYSYDKLISMKDIIKCTSGGYLMIGIYDVGGTYVPLLIKIDEGGLVNTNLLEGKIVKDIDKNCKIAITDKPFIGCLVEAKNKIGESYWGLTDSFGNYSINLDTGNYMVKVYAPNNYNYWQSCTPSVSKTISSLKKTDSLDFLLYPVIDCPALEVQITTPILRRCFNNNYTVKYCNKGTVKADNAYVTVMLDSLMEFISASKSITSQSGRTYRFNLGNLSVDDCGSFDIITRVRCSDSTRLGQTLCVEAKIFPDTICTPLSLWSGANMTVTGTCLKDSVQFQVRNTGTAPSAVRNSVVVEDEVMFLKIPIQLPQNGVFTRKFPANGKTWRMAVEQEPNHPTSSTPTAFVEGCRANNSLPFTTGFATRFANDDKALTIDTDCKQIVGAYDPNDKQGFPTGYKSERFVAQNQDIEYLIRFQNTGTDTAFTVVVRDTISEKLDISSIEFGASSHVYEPEIYGKGIVKFTFNNIKLVDSSKNEAKSHGFIQYRIKQQKDLVWGTKIFNNAGIYFDFNEPIITNKTLHTVGGKEIISAIIEKNNGVDLLITVSPNPFTETAIFETPLSISADFQVFDMTGKTLRKEKFEGTSFEFHRKGLAAGIYIFKIVENNKTLSVGKLIVQ